MLRRVALVRTDVSEEPGSSFIRVTRIGELGTTQTATSNRPLRRNTTWYFFAAVAAVKTSNLLRKLFGLENERRVWRQLRDEYQNVLPPPNLIMVEEHISDQNN
jgi:hypothetical protein